MNPILQRASRSSLYVLSVCGFAACAGIAAAIGGNSSTVLYLCVLFALCASPLLYVHQLNGRYAILCIFLAAYFVFYGALDLLRLVSADTGPAGKVLISLTEMTVVLGAALVILGYRGALLLSRRDATPLARKEWSTGTMVMVGSLLWSAGTAATWIWQVYFQRNGVEFDANVGSAVINAAVLGRMIQPLGVLILAYAYFVTRNRALLLLVIGVLLVQVFVGFIGDSKELGMRGAILVVMTAFLVNGRAPRAWLVCIGLFAVFAFPVFQAYRAEIIMSRGESRADAARDIGRSLKLALQSKDRVASGQGAAEDRAQTFIERASLKGNLELTLARVGHDVRFQNGATLWPLFTAFIPRLVWRDKRDSSSGQLFNTEFRISEDDRTYISPTQLGELYWNFGWLGILLGMPLIGFLLGYVNCRCDLSERRSMTRLLIVVTTIYTGCVRFEGSIALEYTLWMRSMAVILLLHWLFARPARTAAVATDATHPPASESEIRLRPFANLLR